MKKFSLTLIALLTATSLVAQQRQQEMVKILGQVTDKLTGNPLAYATIGVAGRVEQAYSQANGGFILNLPSESMNDTLVVTYVGYNKFEQIISTLMPSPYIRLEPAVMMLPEAVISNKKIDWRYLDRNARVIRGNLYGMNCEVTNMEYNYFLISLQERHDDERYEKYRFDLSRYPAASAAFYNRYHDPSQKAKKNRKDTVAGYGDYPAVNISHAAAVAYCEWLTEQYNENPTRKKFKKVLFRLPTKKEWQITALGYDRFKSWNILENEVETIISIDTIHGLDKGKRTMIPVTDKVLYPWYKFYSLRDKPQNYKKCFLGNFRVDVAEPCPAQNLGYDGFIIMGRVGCYFPNNIGFYDVVGNVAEMIDEDGVALGGSWKDIPSESTIHSMKTYSGPDESVGFRVFMEVVER